MQVAEPVPSPAPIPAAQVYRVEVQIFHQGWWQTGIRFEQDVPLSENGKARCWSKVYHGVHHHSNRPTKMRILQNGDIIVEEKI